jgi:hypothetical protein
LNDSVDRGDFVRQLYNLRHVLGNEETEDAKAKIQRLQNRIDQHNKEYPMKSFHTEDTPNSDVDDRGVGATDCAELGVHGYEVEPRVFVDDESGYVMESFSKVRQPLSTYAPR